MAIQYGSGNTIKNGMIGGRALLRLWDRVEQALFEVYKRNQLPTFDLSGAPCQPRGTRDLLDCFYPIEEILIYFPPSEMNWFSRLELEHHLPDDLRQEYAFYFDDGRPRRESRDEETSAGVQLIPLDKAARPGVDNRWNTVAQIVEAWPVETRTLTFFRSDQVIKAILGDTMPGDRTIREQLSRRNIRLQK